MSQPIKTALIGYGHLGKYHAQKCAILDSCDFVAIVDSNAEARKQARTAYPKLQVVEKWNEVADAVEALLLVSPTSTHHHLLQQGLQRGKHIFCEKTLCTSFAQAQELSRVAGLYPGQVVQVGHSERFHQVWKVLDDFSMLNCPGGTIRMDRLAPFKGRATDVGVVQDLMSHDLDLLLHVLGERPIAIRAQGFKIRTGEWDHVNCHFTLASGRTADVTVGRNYTFEKRSLEMVNEQGHLYIDLCRHQILTLDQRADDVQVVDYQQCDHLLEQQREFYHCIQSGGRPQVSLEQAVDVMFYLDKVTAALESQQTIKL